MTRQGITLLIGYIGSLILAVPSWISPVLGSAFASELDRFSFGLAHGAADEHAAWGVLVTSIVIASCLAWRAGRQEFLRLHKSGSGKSFRPRIKQIVHTHGGTERSFAAGRERAIG